MPQVGRAAPDFRLQSIEGDEVSLAAFKGRPALVNLWASWCFRRCIAEHEVLLEAQERYGDAERFVARYGNGGWPNFSTRRERWPSTSG